MRTLVTGGAGFIGSCIADVLIKNGHSVIVLDNLSTGKKANLNGKAVFYEADIRDKETMSKVFLKEKPQIVFHLAAQVDVMKSLCQPCLDAECNIIGSLNVLESCKLYGVKKIIYSNSGGAGSGEPKYFPIDEKHPIEPMAHYGVSKHTVEHYLKIYRDLYGIKYTSLRYANIYGPRQDPFGEGGVVAIFSNKLLTNDRPKIFGDGEQTRDFMYVEDVATVNLLCMKKGDDQILNVGTGIETSVNELFSIIKEITGSSLSPLHAPERTGEIRRSVFNIDRLESALSWKQAVNLREGLVKTVDYFRGLNKDRARA